LDYSFITRRYMAKLTKTEQTGKGALLATGIALMTIGSTLVSGKEWIQGAILVIIGVGLIFLREYLKK
jgi:hypothetical protein